MKKILLSCLLALFFSTTLSAQELTPPQADSPKGKFEWVETVHDFGPITQGIPVTHKFEFKNVGEAPLTVKNVRRTCGCTVTDWSKEVVQPGESGYVTAQFNAAGMGNFNKGITVESDSETPIKMLYFKGTVIKKENLDLSGGSMMESKPLNN